MTVARIGIDYTAAVRQRAGIGRYTRELVRALLRLDSAHQYVIFAATGGVEAARWESEVHRMRASDVQLRTLPLSDDWMARLWHRLRLPIPVEVVTGPLDVFYSPDFVLPPTRRATRALLTVHDLSFLLHPEAFVPALGQYLVQVVPRSIDQANLVLADSASTRADIISRLSVPSDKVRVLYCGVDPCFRPEPEAGRWEQVRACYDLSDRPYILAVGTLQPRKNYVRLIRAFARLLTRESMNPTDFQLLIAGGRGWLYRDILAEAERYDNVHILGFVNDADLPTFYRNSALLACPSLYEGFGLTVLEAMACGTPVVCSNVSSLPEVAGDAALLVDPFDVDGIADAMLRLLMDADLRRDMIERGVAQAARFTWERAARQLLSVLTECTEL